MTRLVIAPTALGEIDEIVDFIASDSPSAADRVRDAIFREIDRIAEWPAIGHSREDLTSQPVRFWNVMGRYSIVYEGNAETVRVLRVFGPGRDIARLLS